MKEFKVGDKVYCPTFSTQVLEIGSNSNSTTYPLRISTGYCSESFTKEGYINGRITSTSIVLATQENKELLEKLYGVAFEAAPPKTRTVTFEMPETFIPNRGENYWYINNVSDNGVGCETNIGSQADHRRIINGVWRTKEEALMVANAIFNIEKDS